MVKSRYVVLVAWNDGRDDAICEFDTLKGARRFIADTRKISGVIGLTLLRRMAAWCWDNVEGAIVPCETESEER